MTDALSALREQFPLSARWTEVESFGEAVTIGGASFTLVGFAASDPSGVGITGSAVGDTPRDAERAYFELLERAAVVESMDSVAPVELVGLDQRPTQRLPSALLWPQSPNPSEWQFSKSNGVAAHTSWTAACDGAAFELLERDRIMRSWFFGGVPRKLPLVGIVDGTKARDLAGIYDFCLYELGERVGGAVVHAFFAFPRAEASPDAPVVYGFGCGTTGPAAARRALDECLQRLAFLWGEVASPEDLAFAPTADYHQAFYMRRETIATLHAWLEGRYAYGPVASPAAPPPSLDEILFADITPPQLVGRAVVVKAHCEAAERLFFGHRFGSQAPLLRRLHPVA